MTTIAKNALPSEEQELLRLSETCGQDMARLTPHRDKRDILLAWRKGHRLFEAIFVRTMCHQDAFILLLTAQTLVRLQHVALEAWRT